MSFRCLIQEVSYYAGENAVPILEEAFQVAQKFNDRVNLPDNKNLVSHSLSVARVLADWQAPVVIVVLGLLQSMFRYDIHKRQEFSRISKSLQGNDREQFKEILDNILLFDSEMSLRSDILLNIYQYDWRTLVIKLAENLVHLKSSRILQSKDGKQVAHRATEVFVPTADHLGMGIVKRQLEDLSFEVLEPDRYIAIQEQCMNYDWSKKKQALLGELKQVVKDIESDSEVSWQSFSLYSISQYNHFSKIENSKNLLFLDTGIFIILTKDADSCYSILKIHRKYPPTRQFQDLIASRRENGYQSLHTCLRYSSSDILHVIIRSYTMDLIANYGVTARWRGLSQDHSLNISGVNNCKNIHVYTPGGKEIVLPRSATPIDFAYEIHSNVGDSCTAALVNGEPTPLTRPLLDGDLVDIRKGPGPSFLELSPSLEWLRYVQTQNARYSIRRWLTNYHRHEMAAEGLSLLGKELRQFGRTPDESYVKTALRHISYEKQKRRKEQSEKDVKLEVRNIKKDEYEYKVDDLYVDIGVGRIQAATIAQQVEKFLRKPRMLEERILLLPNGLNTRNGDVIEEENSSYSNSAVRFERAACCSPQMADAIVGYQHEDVVQVHTAACPDAPKDIESVPVTWDVAGFVIAVVTGDRPGMAADVSQIMATHDVDMIEFDAYVRPDGKIEIRIRPSYILPGQNLEKIKKEIELIPLVEEVRFISSALVSSFSDSMRPSIDTANTNANPSVSNRPHVNTLSIAPFGPGVARADRFSGRKREFRELRLILDEPGSVILLRGLKRIGKTSLLLNLSPKLEKDGFVTVLIDMQRIMSMTTFQFMNNLINNIAEKINMPSELVPHQERVKRQPLLHFKMFMSKVQEILKNRPLCIMIDECLGLSGLTEQFGISNKGIFDQLQYSLHDFERSPRIILSGAGRKNDLMNCMNINGQYNNVYDYPLDNLDFSDARCFIIDTLKIDKDMPQLADEALDWVLNVTMGHPYYINILMKEICGQIRRYGRSKKFNTHVDMTREEIVEVTDRWILSGASGESLFRHLWQNPKDLVDSGRKKIVLSAIAELEQTNSAISGEDLEHVLGTRISRKELDLVLEELIELGVLTTKASGSYMIKVKLAALWLHRRRPLKDVLEDTSVTLKED